MNKIEELIEKLCPNGVEYKELGEISNIETGEQLNRSKLFDKGLYPVLNGGVGFSGFYDEYNNEENTIAISQGGASAGYVNFMLTKFWAGAHCFIICPNIDIVINKFLFYYLKNGQLKLQSTKKGAGIPGINRGEVKKFQIAIPPLAIQQEIVNILDKFTELEVELEVELEARRKQYEYYRNQLLTPIEVGGKWLMNGDEVEWKTLGEIGEFIRGNGLQKKDFTETGIGCIHYGQIYTYYGTYTYETKSFVSPELGKKLKKAQKGDLVIAATSENVEDVCKAVAWLGEEEIAISGDAYIYRHYQNPKYIAYYYKTQMFFEHKKKYVSGTKVIRVSGDNMAKLKIPIPPLSEQERIVGILDKFDALVNDISKGLPAEIEARRKQYEYYRNKLLTFKEKE